MDKRAKEFSKLRTGEINYNRYGSKMTIIEYTNSKNIVVKFENGYTVKSCYSSFIEGKIANPYDKSVCGVGYIGEGVYKTSIGDNHTDAYSRWKGMLMRCYTEKYRDKNPTYEDKYVCDEWHNFQNFADWYDKNYYEVDYERMELDKDILHKGNKIYSPGTCVFVPYFINYLFVKDDATRGKYPIGVSMCNNRLRARYKRLENRKQKEIHIGFYDTEIEAFNAYKREKEKYIKEVADDYKDKIPPKLYEAMYNYKVEITD